MPEIDQFAVSSEMQPLKDEYELYLQDLKKGSYYTQRGAKYLDPDDFETAISYLQSAASHKETYNDLMETLLDETEVDTTVLTPSPTPEETPTPVVTPTSTPSPTPTPTPQTEEDSDGDGVPDDYDYAPKDPNVQSQADVKTPGFGAIFAIVSVLVVVFSLRRKR